MVVVWWVWLGGALWRAWGRLWSPLLSLWVGLVWFGVLAVFGDGLWFPRGSLGAVVSAEDLQGIDHLAFHP